MRLLWATMARAPRESSGRGRLLSAHPERAAQEYVPFGNLFRNIHHPSASEKDVLQWYNRGRRVAIDVARGLVYLHGRKARRGSPHAAPPMSMLVEHSASVRLHRFLLGERPCDAQQQLWPERACAHVSCVVTPNLLAAHFRHSGVTASGRAER